MVGRGVKGSLKIQKVLKSTLRRQIAKSCILGGFPLSICGQHATNDARCSFLFSSNAVDVTTFQFRRVSVQRLLYETGKPKLHY